MSAFDKIIGYEPIKEELRQLCDMMHHGNIYEKLGAKMPKGLLFHGEPGTGKTLMAHSFIQESGRKAYIIRRNKPTGDFIDEIKRVFSEAADNAPSIILLDDMDKFVVEEDGKEEYIAVQACIDGLNDADVYVISTANDLYSFPDSLLRAGRFDRKICVDLPEGDDAAKIIQHYISSKSVENDLCVEDITKMLNGKSCADLETLLNEAAIYAGFERCNKITMEHIVRSVLRNEYGASKSVLAVDNERLEAIAYHEAGHVVVSELQLPYSTGLASLCTRSDRNGLGGFVVRCADPKSSMQNVPILLAGNAATELKFGITTEGGSDDIRRAIEKVKESVVYNAGCGIGVADIFRCYQQVSNDLRARQELIIQTEIERFATQAKQMLAENMVFLDTVAAALLEKETLLHSDIRKLRESMLKETA